MVDSVQTSDVIIAEGAEPRSARAARPGLVVLFAGGRQQIIPVPTGGEPIEIGREHGVFSGSPDARISRRHASVRFDGARFIVTDLGSRNGTTVDGERLTRGASREAARVIRVGDTLLLPLADITHLVRDLGVASGAQIPARIEQGTESLSTVQAKSTGALPKRPPRATIAAALERHEGNISAAARALGVHRTQLRRWIDRYHMDLRAFAPRGEEPAAVSSARF